MYSSPLWRDESWKRHLIHYAIFIASFLVERAIHYSVSIESIQCVLRLRFWKGRHSRMSMILCEFAADNRRKFGYYFDGFSIYFSLLRSIDGNIPFGIGTHIFIFRISNVGIRSFCLFAQNVNFLIKIKVQTLMCCVLMYCVLRRSGLCCCSPVWLILFSMFLHA